MRVCTLHKASGADQSAFITLLVDHGADVHAITRVGDCSTAFGVSHSMIGVYIYSI